MRTEPLVHGEEDVMLQLTERGSGWGPLDDVEKQFLIYCATDKSSGDISKL